MKGKPAWAGQKGGNPEGSPSLDEDVTITSATSAASVDSLSDDRRKLSGSESEASESEDSQASGESVASVSSLDERRVTSATSLSLASEETETSASSSDERRKLPGKGNAPEWAGSKGGNPDGSPSDDVTVTSATSVASDDSEESEESEASVSVSSLDDERRKLPGNANPPAYGRGGNPNGSPSDDVTVTSATSVASDDSGTSATSAASADSVASVDSSAE